MSFEDAVKLMLVSFDSTLKANLSVGLPLDIQVYETDSFRLGSRRRVEADDPYYQTISTSWGEALSQALKSLPDFVFPDDAASSR
jgi:putative proteasome-type protease